MATLKRRAELFLDAYQDLGFELETSQPLESDSELVARGSN
jgi:hypothetical protein